MILTDQKLWKNHSSASVTFYHYSQYSLKGRSVLARYCTVQCRVTESFASHHTKESSYRCQDSARRIKSLQVTSVRVRWKVCSCQRPVFAWALAGGCQGWHAQAQALGVALERPLVLSSRLVAKMHFSGTGMLLLAICALPVKTLPPSPKVVFSC